MRTKRARVRKVPAVNLIKLRLSAVEHVVTDLNEALRAAIARKPNAVLTQLVYQLKMTRVELAAVQEQLAANNAILERLVPVVHAHQPLGLHLHAGKL